MKRSLFLVPAIAFGLLAGQGAFAQPKGGASDSPPAAPSKSSQRTRADVQAECDAARKSGAALKAECGPN